MFLLAEMLVMSTTLSACLPSVTGGPPRLFTVDEETRAVRQQLGPVEFGDYYALGEAESVAYRNEYVAGRMYAIDIQYTRFEASLTKERQQIGFLSSTANLGLTTASTLIKPTSTKDILTATAGLLTGTKSAYGDNILLAKSIEILQTQMRANRAKVATQILARMKLSTSDYPLAFALSDLEAYYQAGTITGALVEVSQTVGEEADNAETAKADALISSRFVKDDARATVLAYVYPAGINGTLLRENRDRLIAQIVALKSVGQGEAELLYRQVIGGSSNPEIVELRAQLATRIKGGL